VRIRIDFAYDGTDFKGWATQPSLRTVQGDLEEALATVLRLPAARVVVAGRTDTGVHARRQVAHFDVDAEVIAASAGRTSETPLGALRRRLNGFLAADVRVNAVTEAPLGFDARFSATWRRYAYRIADAPELFNPLTRHHVVHWQRPLDVDVMNAASQPLIGLKDFKSFCKRREGATTVRTLQELRWERNDEGIVVGTVVADAFCHNMVRALVGCLVAIGDGREQPEWAASVLTARARDGKVTVIHAHGLTLEEVGYPEDAELAAQAVRARATREILHG
jgi:tRNA pseudouridine38-40 synthase